MTKPTRPDMAGHVLSVVLIAAVTLYVVAQFVAPWLMFFATILVGLCAVGHVNNVAEHREARYQAELRAFNDYHSLIRAEAESRRSWEQYLAQQERERAVELQQRATQLRNQIAAREAELREAEAKLRSVRG